MNYDSCIVNHDGTDPSETEVIIFIINWLSSLQKTRAFQLKKCRYRENRGTD